MSSITVSLVMAVVMPLIVAPVIVVSRIPVPTVIIAPVRSLIVISIRLIVGSVIIESEPSVAITKTMTPVVSSAVPVVAPVMVASIMVATAVTPGDQLDRHAVLRLEPV